MNYMKHIKLVLLYIHIPAYYEYYMYMYGYIMDSRHFSGRIIVMGIECFVNGIHMDPLTVWCVHIVVVMYM